MSLNVSVSAGLVLADSNDRTPDDLLHDADLALYASKSQGKGRLTVFHEELRQAEVTGRPTAAQLAAAITGDELLLAYQPVVDLASGEVVGREALVRWQHPSYGMLPPGQFLDLAEADEGDADVSH